VVRPELRLLRLVWIVRVADGSGRLERLVVRRRVVRSEGDVILWMEILGRYLDSKG
jgi:hypothetical protein